ncbi:hypothetical protein K491DRAFT_691000 [Lophiostoma macrostomum CBS 122681]|uniref:Uncharacterized protein n=1 Tax=Lophiostoma macrostomum CBS 122681 TaxID=1314788 RepID=A0A6A6TC36_9PLEO|nr:hypothetical protein K491DRAFT_691000 [Lophiostoma macrostomum CBS 122681]
MLNLVPWPWSRTTAVVTAFSVYVVACRALRYLRVNRKHAKYPYKTREDFCKMTTEHAWEIALGLSSLEFPFTFEKSLQFALFRTYGIPSISALLAATAEFSTTAKAPRRYVDTGVLIGEFLGHSPTSLRANSAISRMNFLHDRYRRASKISDDDMLYTLSLFVLEPVRWIEQYEWRSMTDMEICAIGTFWKSMGKAMSIPFDALTGGPDSFRDGLDFYQSLKAWSLAYEERVMLPAQSNHTVAEQTTSILLYNIPTFMHPAGKNAVYALMDERLRRAMLYPDPPPIYPRLVAGILYLRKLVIRHLLPPRPSFLAYETLSKTPDPVTGRYYQTVYEAEPWYVKPTFFARNAPRSWLAWAVGMPYPDGKSYKPQGYDVYEVGPPALEGKGREWCVGTTERLMGDARGGCPFAVR